MRNLINLVLVLLLGVLGAVAIGNPLLSNSKKNQNEGQNASQDQQAPSARGQSNAAVQSVTGCVVKGEHGFSLKTESDTYPLETDRDLSQYVNKQVKLTGILEHHTAASPSAASGNAATVTNIRLRMIATVVGDCNPPSK